MPDRAIESSNGLHFKGSGGEEVSADPETVKHILASIERMWDSALEWAHSNPSLFVVFLIFLLIALFIIVQGTNDRAKMKIEYEKARKDAKIQISLPLNDQDDR